MDCRAISSFFRQALARGTAIRSGGGVRIRIEELISLIFVLRVALQTEQDMLQQVLCKR